MISSNEFENPTFFLFVYINIFTLREIKREEKKFHNNKKEGKFFTPKDRDIFN